MKHTSYRVNVRKNVYIGRYLADFHKKVARPTVNVPTQIYLKGFMLILKLGCVIINIVQFSQVKQCVKIRRLLCTYVGIVSFLWGNCFLC